MNQSDHLKQAMEDIEAAKDTLILNLISMGDGCRKLITFGDDRYLRMADGNPALAELSIKCSEHFQTLVSEGLCLTDALGLMHGQDYLSEYVEAAFPLGEGHV